MASKIPCDECRPFGERAIRAIHDMVNIKLGKPVYDPEGLRLFQREVNRAVGSCRRLGSCATR